MSAKRRIALYGGTFDPVHLGHLEVARRAAELFEIERVLFVPAQLAPHKSDRHVSDPLHRYAMLVLATQNEKKLFVSTFELDVSGRRYTVDTIAHFQNVLSEVEIFFIMGADSWSEITTWREWQRLLGMVNHVVVTRPGYEIQVSHVGPAILDRIVDLRAGAGNKALNATTTGPRIFITDAVMKDISATAIRRAARENGLSGLTKFVPSQVADYIVKYSLYQNSNETEYS